MMLKILLKKQLAELFRSYFYDAKKNKARPKGKTILLFVLFGLLMVGLLGGMFTVLSLAFCAPLTQAGLGWLYFALIGLLALLLGTFGSVFNTFAALYLAKDNDLLLSLPIPVRDIMASRLLSVYLMGLLYSGVVFLPAVIVYYCVAPLNAGRVVGPVLLLVLLSVFVLTVSCFLGWVVAKISLRLRNKSFITVFLSVVFFGAYYFVCFRAQSALESLLANVETYSAKLQSVWPMYVFGRAGDGDWLSMAVLALLVLALFAVLWRQLARGFLGIATATGRVGKTVHRAKPARASSADAALRRKEFARFTSSPNYMLNCGMGTLLLLVLAVLLLVKSQTLLTQLELLDTSKDVLLVLLTAVINAAATMNDTTAPSVSLEGRSLWLAQSLPVQPWQVLRAKLAVQLTITLPMVLLCVVCGAAALRLSAVEAVFAVLVTAAFCVLMAVLGLTLGVKMPNLHWTREIVPIKQSMPVAITLLGGWLYVALVAVVYFGLHWNVHLYLGLVTAVTGVLAAVLLAWLKTHGAARFAEL